MPCRITLFKERNATDKLATGSDKFCFIIIYPTGFSNSNNNRVSTSRVSCNMSCNNDGRLLGLFLQTSKER